MWITHKSYPHFSCISFPNKEEKNISSSHVPACFAIHNDIRHRHEQTHLSVFPTLTEGKAVYQQQSHQHFSKPVYIWVFST